MKNRKLKPEEVWPFIRKHTKKSKNLTCSLQKGVYIRKLDTCKVAERSRTDVRVKSITCIRIGKVSRQTLKTMQVIDRATGEIRKGVKGYLIVTKFYADRQTYTLPEGYSAIINVGPIPKAFT